MHMQNIGCLQRIDARTPTLLQHFLQHFTAAVLATWQLPNIKTSHECAKDYHNRFQDLEFAECAPNFSFTSSVGTSSAARSNNENMLAGKCSQTCNHCLCHPLQFYRGWPTMLSTFYHFAQVKIHQHPNFMITVFIAVAHFAVIWRFDLHKTIAGGRNLA